MKNHNQILPKFLNKDILIIFAVTTLIIGIFIVGYIFNQINGFLDDFAKYIYNVVL